MHKENSRTYITNVCTFLYSRQFVQFLGISNGLFNKKIFREKKEWTKSNFRCYLAMTALMRYCSNNLTNMHNTLRYYLIMLL